MGDLIVTLLMSLPNPHLTRATDPPPPAFHPCLFLKSALPDITVPAALILPVVKALTRWLTGIGPETGAPWARRALLT